MCPPFVGHPEISSASEPSANRQLTHRIVRTQDFPDFWVLGGLRAIRTELQGWVGSWSGGTEATDHEVEAALPSQSQESQDRLAPSRS
jgi:hypothetical protein